MAIKLDEIKRNIDKELQMAEDSRRKGNEGKARVCARRAAGAAIGYHFERQTGDSAPKSAYTLLHWASDHTGSSMKVHEAARRLTVRVTREHELPHREDPIADAHLIINSLMDSGR